MRIDPNDHDSLKHSFIFHARQPVQLVGIPTSCGGLPLPSIYQVNENIQTRTSRLRAAQPSTPANAQLITYYSPGPVQNSQRALTITLQDWRQIMNVVRCESAINPPPPPHSPFTLYMFAAAARVRLYASFFRRRQRSCQPPVTLSKSASEASEDAWALDCLGPCSISLYQKGRNKTPPDGLDFPSPFFHEHAKLCREIRIPNGLCRELGISP